MHHLTSALDALVLAPYDWTKRLTPAPNAHTVERISGHCANAEGRRQELPWWAREVITNMVRRLNEALPSELAPNAKARAVPGQWIGRQSALQLNREDI